MGSGATCRVDAGAAMESGDVVDCAPGGAAGVSGDRRSIEACLLSLGREEERVAMLAGGAVAVFTGMDPSVPYVADERDIEENRDGEGSQMADLDVDLREAMEDELPLPDAEAVMEWWRENGGRSVFEWKAVWRPNVCAIQNRHRMLRLAATIPVPVAHRAGREGVHTRSPTRPLPTAYGAIA